MHEFYPGKAKVKDYVKDTVGDKKFVLKSS
jgi:hypothetical protein